MPQRAQRRRTKGWRAPPNSLCVTRPSKWSNPRKVGDHWNHKPMTIEDVLHFYRLHISNEIREGRLNLDELRQYDYLLCYCPLDRACHVDVLMELLEENK